MPFKDLPEGTTHYQNDNCGEPAHNKVKHRRYCAKSNMRCLVDHLGEACPDITDCKACHAERILISPTKSCDPKHDLCDYSPEKI